MAYENNILTLVRLGFISPDSKYEDIKRTLIYRIWEHFSLVCVHAEYESLNPPKIKCKKLNTQCNFELCPILRNAIKDFERKRKFKGII